jgi:hypothetical protein
MHDRSVSRLGYDNGLNPLVAERVGCQIGLCQRFSGDEVAFGLWRPLNYLSQLFEFFLDSLHIREKRPRVSLRIPLRYAPLPAESARILVGATEDATDAQVRQTPWLH